MLYKGAAFFPGNEKKFKQEYKVSCRNKENKSRKPQSIIHTFCIAHWAGLGSDNH